MSVKKPDVIIAKPVASSEQEQEATTSIMDVVDSILGQSVPQAKGVFKKVVSEITDTIFNESPSSLLEDEQDEEQPQKKEGTTSSSQKKEKPQASSQDEVEEESQPIKLNPKNDEMFIKKVIQFLSGREFEEQCVAVGAKHNLPPKVVAKNFCLRILGTIGDVLGIAIEVSRNFIKGTIQLLTSILLGGVDLICNVAQGLASVITLNQTAQPRA